MLQVLYLVHDLADPAVRRRVLMLKEGGAHVSLAGFRRSPSPIDDIEGVVPVDLGPTHDGRFAQRLLAVATAAWTLSSRLRGVGRPNVIVARNLEMLALAARARSALQGDDIPVVYECLDIHRLLLRDDFVGGAMRAAERRLARQASLLLTSSPAFVREYFDRRRQVSVPVELVENRHFEPDAAPPPDDGTGGRPPGPPWRIGWFGALRCRRSLQLLAEFSRRAGGQFEVVLRGRPAFSEFDDFHGLVGSEPFLTFEGPYRNPEDVAGIYGGVHFAWVIDFFEEGLNSRWLLPNRLYEGCRFGAVPIAMTGTETARFLRSRNIGVVLPEPSVEAISQALGGIDLRRFEDLQSNVLMQERATWSCDRDSCRKLVDRLRRLGASPRVSLSEALA